MLVQKNNKLIPTKVTNLTTLIMQGDYDSSNVPILEVFFFIHLAAEWPTDKSCVHLIVSHIFHYLIIIVIIVCY